MGFFDWARELFGLGKLHRETIPAGIIEREFGVQPAASRKMEDSIDLWWAMYTGHPPWETACVRPLGLPEAIGRELARHVLTEFSMSVSGSARAEYIDRQMQAVVQKFSSDLEMGLCLGGVALKPYPDGGRILVETFTTRFTPTRFDGSGKAIGGVFRSEPVRVGREWFIKLEYHDFLRREDGSSVYVVENKAFRSGQDGGQGVGVSLDSVPEWAGLEEHWEIAGLEGPLFAWFEPPQANHVDPASPLGVSVYAGATVDLIRQADEMWEKLFWEYDSGERKVLMDRSAVWAGQVKDRLFEYGTFRDPNFFQFLNPEMRDDPFYNGFQRILQRIEFNVGLAFGTISDPQSVERTATEILAAKQRQFITGRAIQTAFQGTLEGLLYAMNAWCDLAQLAPAGVYETAFNWGDSVLDDPDTRRQDMALDASLVGQGLLNDWEFRMKWYGEDEETAKRMLPKLEDLTDEDQDEVE